MTTVTAAPQRVGARAQATHFYFYMSLCCAAVAFSSFTPTYWLPMKAGTLKVNPIVHIHGAVFFSWSMFFVLQTWLASSGRVAWHRSVGMIGVSFATAMTIFGTLVAINGLKGAAAIGMRDEGMAFVIVPLSTIAFFAVTFALAVAYVRQPDVHKRLMLLAGISILDAPIARWFLTFLAPPGAVGPPPVGAAIPPAIVAYLLVVAAMVFDWRTRGRPHAVYAIGGTAFLLLNVFNVPISSSYPWRAFASGLLALAQ